MDPDRWGLVLQPGIRWLSNGLVAVGIVFFAFLVFSTPFLFGDVTAVEDGVTLEAPLDDTVANHGRIYGDLSVVSAGGRTGLAFDGSDDYLEFERKELVRGDSFSVSLWLRIRTDDAVVLSDSGGYMMSVRTWENRNVVFTVQTDQGQESAWVPIPAIDDGEWHHYVLVYDGSELREYVDGDLEDTAKHAGDVVYDSERTFTLGRLDTASDEFYEGDVSDLRVYDRALGAVEVRQIHSGATEPVAAPDTGRRLNSFGLIGFVAACAAVMAGIRGWTDGR